MLNTFLTGRRDIKMQTIRDRYTLYFFGDVHRFVKSCDVDRWNWFLSNAKKEVEARPDHTFFIGMGDYDDFASTLEKREMAKLHETTIETFDEMCEKRMRIMASEMKFMKGRTIGLIQGNHDWVFQDGESGTMKLAKRLESEYLGYLCHYTLSFQYKGKSMAVYMVLTHGKAGGKTYGITINQVGDLKQIFPAADIYCAGHDHQRGAWPVSVLLPNPIGGLKQKRQFLCRSGSFKKAYQENTAGYEISRLLRPADLGALKLNIGFHRDRKDGNDSIITDIVAEI
jgi:hypothetical protein